MNNPTYNDSQNFPPAPVGSAAGHGSASEARKFEQYYEIWRSTHGEEAAALWLAATAGNLSARVALLEKQLKRVDKIVRQNVPALAQIG